MHTNHILIATFARNNRPTEMLVFDCEKLKFPDTGLYHFCDSLGKALKKRLATDGGMTFFLNRKLAGHFGDDCGYLPYRSIYKYIFPYWRARGAIWHSTQQFPKVMPGRLRTVLTVHDLNFLYEEPEETRRSWLDRLQHNVDKASRVVAISGFTRDDLLKHIDLRGRTVDVIYNGCTAYGGKPGVPDYVPSGPFLFTVGTLLRKKNFHVLPALLVGNGYELVISGLRFSYEEQILRTASELGVLDRVHVTGPVSEAAKDWYMRNCRAFLFPSIAEGFGLPPIEAMLYGKPVFLSRYTSLPEIGGDKAFYFNREFDFEGMRKEFAEGLEAYDSGKVTPEEISAHARKFSWDKAAEEYIRIYKSLEQ